MTTSAHAPFPDLDAPLAAALLDALAAVPDAPARLRLTARLSRSLVNRGESVAPPALTWQIAGALGLDCAAGLGAAACLLYAAADLADDIIDGDDGVDPLQSQGDVHRMLFLQQRAIASLALPPDRRLALCEAFAEAGIAMCAGQELDLASTGRDGPVDAGAIALGKAGAELALLVSAPAVALGEPPGPWADFGRAYGALLQVFSDYQDLFGKPDSPDWLAAKRTLPLNCALADPAVGPGLRRLLAGERQRPGRLSVARGLMLEAGALERLQDEARSGFEAMDAAAAALGTPPTLRALREGLAAALGQASTSLGRRRAAPRLPPLSARAQACASAARAFLVEDPLFRESHEVIRRRLFGRPEVRGELFGPQVICEALAGLGLPLDRALDAVFSAADRDGWRYFPGVEELPPDSDCTGLALQLAARFGRREHRAVKVGEAALLANADEEGLYPTWLVDGRRYTRAEVDRRWMGGFCPGVNANALMGLWAIAPNRHRDRVRRGAVSLARRVASGAPAPGTYYTPTIGDCWALKALLATRGATAGDPVVQRGISACVDRLRERIALDGRAGSTLETALTAWTLCRAGALDESSIPLIALVDGQESDGGYPADGFYRTVPDPLPRWYGSRAVTAAVTLRTISLLHPMISKVSTVKVPVTAEVGTGGVGEP